MSFSFNCLLVFIVIKLILSFQVICNFEISDGKHITYQVGGKEEITKNATNSGKVYVTFEVQIYERVVIFFKRNLGTGDKVRQIHGTITIDETSYRIDNFARLDWVNETNFEIHSDHIRFPAYDSDEHLIFTIESEEFLCNLASAKRFKCESVTLTTRANTILSIPIGNKIQPLLDTNTDQLYPPFTQEGIVNIVYTQDDNVQITQRGYPLTSSILSNWLSTPFEFMYLGDMTCTEIIYYSVYRNKCVERDCEDGVITIQVCSQNCQTCESNGGTFRCKECKDGYAFRDSDNQCVLISSYTDYYVDNNGYLQPCSSQCSSCTNAADASNHHCLECKDGYYKYKIPNTNTEYSCFSSIEDSYYLINGTDNELTLCEVADGFIYESSKLCLSQCKQPFNDYYQVQNTNECIDECSSHSTSKIYSGDGKYCVASCNGNDGYPYQHEDEDGKLTCKETCDKYILTDTNGNKICTDSCGSLYVHTDTNECIANCNDSVDPTTNQPLLHLIEGSRICTGSCNDKYPFYLETSNMCVKDCAVYNTKMDTENMKCVDTCTSPYQAYVSNKTCVITCPSDAPYINEDQQCVDQCDAYIHGNNKQCVSSCAITESKYIDSTNPKQCVYQCQPTDKLSGYHCVKNCEGDTPYEYEQGKLCLSKCEDNNYYQYNGNKCLSQCGDYLYTYEHVIDVSTVVKKCLTQCEDPLPIMFTNNMTCISSCPDDYLVYPSPQTCVTSCYGVYPYEENGKCVPRCSEGKVIHNNKCISNCPSGKYIDINGINCVDECLIPNNYIIQNKCSNSCNDVHQFYYEEDSTCYVQCSDIVSSSTQPLYTINDEANDIKTCVDECAYPYVYELSHNSERYCVTQCKDITSLNDVDHMYIASNGKECVAQCNSDEFIYNDEQCVSECKGKYKYHDVHSNTCVDYCKDTQYIDYQNKRCYDVCPTDKKVINVDGRKECFDGECPLEFKYHRDNICLRNCDEVYLYTYGNECVTEDECNGHIVIEEKLCLSQCEGKYSYLNTIDNHCVVECPLHLYASNDKKCSGECPQNEFYINNPKHCVTACNQTLFPFVSAENNECVNECQIDEKYAIGNDAHYCLKGCSGMFKYEYGNTKQCVEECEGAFPLTNGMKCVNKCEGVNYIEYDNKCVANCEGMFLVGEPERCVEACPSRFPFVMTSGKCVTHCVAPNAKYYEDDGKKFCTNVCPNGEPSISATGECVTSCPIEYPYIQEGFNTCVSSCYEPTPYLDEVHSKCVYTCDLTTTYQVEDSKTCVSSCDDGYYTVPALHYCVKDCSKVTGYDYEDSTNKECLNDCMFAQGGNNLHYHKSCVDDCPQFTKPSDSTCTFDLDFVDKTEDFIITSKEKESVIKDLEHVILDISNVGETIKGDDFILQVYPSNSPLKGNAYTSSLNFTQCELTLREKGILNEEEEIIIVKFDYIDETAITNQVEYKVYDSDGNEIDITVCKDVDVYISYPLQNEEQIKYSLGYSMKENSNIDIYDPNSQLNIDLCYPFQINQTDVLLSDRRRLFYLNISLCPDNCNYIGINYTTKAADCRCKTKTLFSPLKNQTIQNILPIDEEFLNEETPTNIHVLKCYKLLSKKECIINNISFWLGSLLLFITILMQIIGECIEKKKLYNKIFSFVHAVPPRRTPSLQKPDTKYGKEKQYLESDSSSPHQTNPISPDSNDPNNNSPLNTINNNNITNTINNNTNSISNSPSMSYLNDNYSFNSLSQKNLVIPDQDIISSSEITKDNQYRTSSFSSPKLTFTDKPNKTTIYNKHQQFPQSLSSNEKFISYPLLKQHKLDKFPYVTAIEYDTRSCCQIYSSYLKEQLLLLRLFYPKSHFDLISIQLLNYVTYLHLSAMFNGLLYFNEYIHYRFINNGKIHVCKTFVNSIASCVLALIAIHLLNRITAYKQILESMFNEIKDREDREDCGNRAIKYFRKKTIGFHFVVVVVMAFSWYYLTLLNCVYKASQLDWALCVIGSLIWEIIGGLIYVGVIAKLRKEGLRKKNKKTYNVSMFLREMIYYY